MQEIVVLHSSLFKVCKDSNFKFIPWIRITINSLEISALLRINISEELLFPKKIYFYTLQGNSRQKVLMFYSLNTIDLHYYIYYAHWIKFWGSHLVTLLLHLMSYTDHLVYPNIYIFLIFLLLLYLSEIPIIAVIPVIVYTSIKFSYTKRIQIVHIIKFPLLYN